MRFLEKFRDISIRSKIKIRTGTSLRLYTNSILSLSSSLLSSFSSSDNLNIEFNLYNKEEIDEIDKKKDNQKG